MASIRNFVSRIPQALMQQFLQSLAIDVAVDLLNGTPTAAVGAIEEAVATMPPGTRGRLVRQIETIENLATEAGDAAIRSMTLHDDLGALPSRHTRALWVFLNDREGFRRAEEAVYADTYRYGRQWTSFPGPAGADLKRDLEAQAAFKAFLREAFDTGNVHIEIFDRARPEFFDGDASERTDGHEGMTSLVQITIYREDLPNAEPAFVDGQLTIQTRRPVIEAAVTYEPSTGNIECVAANRETRSEVVRYFARALLGCAAEFEPCAARSYDLTVLRQRVNFSTDPVDRIEDVSIALLRLHPVETSAERITIERLPASDKDIWTVVDERLGPEALLSNFNIGQARIVIRYRSSTSNRLRSLPIMITHPHRSNIKEQSEIERVVSSKYLARWGLLAAP